MRFLLAALALCFVAFEQASADPRTDYTPVLNECVADSLLDPVALNACRGVLDARCRAEEGASTIALVLCGNDESAAWDQLSAAVLTRLRSSGEPDAVALLDAVQAQWLAFREAECSYRQARFGAGSGAQVEFINCMADLSADRAIDLLIYEPSAD